VPEMGRRSYIEEFKRDAIEPSINSNKTVKNI
jgi:transposase-like protein